MSKKSVLGIVIILALIAFGLYYFNNTKKQQDEVVKVGVVLPLTGDLSFPGNRILNGILLANNENNNKFEIISEDSKGDPKTAKSAIEKLISIDNVDYIIGGMLSSTTQVIKPVAVKNKKVLISPTASSSSLADDSGYFYRVWPSDKSDATTSAQYCLNDLGLKKMAIVYWNNDYSVSLKDDFADFFKNNNGEVLGTFAYEGSTQNFGTIIQKIKDLEVDGVYLPGIPSGNALFVKQAKEQNMNAIIFSNLAAQEEEFKSIAGNSIEGVYFTNLSFDKNLFTTSLFSEKYNLLHEDEADIQALKGYESLELIALYENSSNDSFKNFINQTKEFDFYSDIVKFEGNSDAKVKYNIFLYNNLLEQKIINE